MSASIEFIEKLVCSDRFCKYVLNPDEQTVAYWNEFRKENPDKEEEIIQARQLVLLLGDDKDADDPEIEKRAHQLWKKINTKAHEKHSGRQKGNSSNSIWDYALKVAAVLILIGVVSMILVHLSPATDTANHDLTTNYFQRSTQIGQKGSFYLPDGSHINLNSGSSLHYFENLENSTRELLLEGEAFLQVKEDPSRPFIVRTKDLSAGVLGTSFNVKAYPDDVETKIALVTGKVKVTGNDTDPRVLAPNQMLVFNRFEKSAQVRIFEPEKITCWKDNVLLFDKVGLGEIIARLSRWYGVEIVISDPIKADKELFDQKDYRGKYQDKSLETVLEAIGFSYGFDYEIQGKEVFIKQMERR